MTGVRWLPHAGRSLLRKFGALDEEVARQYIAETVLALEYCHAQVRSASGPCDTWGGSSGQDRAL